MNEKFSRRDVFLSLIKGAGSLLFISGVGQLFGCRRCEKDAKQHVSPAQKAVTPCPDQDALSDQEKSIRATLKYTDSSPLPSRRCNNCKLYTLPKKGVLCGGCQVVPGPVHPEGYCTAWIPQM